MKLKRTLSTIIFVLSITSAFSQVLAQTDSVSAQIEKQYPDRRHFIGSSLFLLGNLDTEEPPAYFQLNYGYQLTRKDIIIVEAITWTYYEPLGTYGSSNEKYPGKIRAYGIGAGYQRFLCKNLYSAFKATPFLQQFFDAEKKIFKMVFSYIFSFNSATALNSSNNVGFLSHLLRLTIGLLTPTFQHPLRKLKADHQTISYLSLASISALNSDKFV